MQDLVTKFAPLRRRVVSWLLSEMRSQLHDEHVTVDTGGPASSVAQSPDFFSEFVLQDML